MSKFYDIEILNDPKLRMKADSAYQALTNNGYVFDGTRVDKYTIRDLVSTPDATRFMPTTVQRVVREALEPSLLVVPSVFQEIRLEGPARSVQIGSVGAMTAGKIAEGNEYPESSLDMDGGDAVAWTISKWGLRISVTDEVMESNQFDIINLWLRAAGRALARAKELEGIRLMNEFGVDVFDNLVPSGASEGVCTGRDIDGSQNGTMTLNDIFTLYAYLSLRGFSPDTILMHPLAWKTFAIDPEVREIFLNGATLGSAVLPGGAPSPGWGTSHNGSGLRTTATGPSNTARDPEWVSPPDTVLGRIGANPWVQTLNSLAATFNVAPRFLPSPIRVIVTPHVFYDSTTYSTPVTNIIMLDSANTGVLLTKDPAGTEEYDDPARDIRSLKIRERYGFALLEQGKGIAVARNVAIDRNYVFDNTNAVALTPLALTTPLTL